MTTTLKAGLLAAPSVRATGRTPALTGNRTTDWLSVVLAPILNKARSAEARQLAIAGDRAVIPLVYGEDRVGGLVINIVPSGANVLVQVVWALQGTAVYDIKYNDLALPAGASASNYDGSQSAADTALANAFSAQGITYAETLAGYMYSVITMPQSAFTGSLQFSARIAGRKVYASGAQVLTNATFKGATASSAGDSNNINGFTGGTATASIVGIGIEDSFPYVDFRISGQAGAGGGFPFVAFNWPTGIANAQTVAGQTWNWAVFIKLMAGALPSGYCSGRILCKDSGGTYLGDAAGLIQSSLPASTTPIRRCGHTYSGALPTSTYQIGFAVALSVGANETVDCTIRIALPRIWHSSGADALMWSSVPAYCLADYLSNVDYGCGKAVDYATVYPVAATNDELVGGSEKRRILGLALTETLPAPEAAEILRAHAGCFLTPGASGIKLVPDAARATDTTYSHASGEIAALQRVTKKDTGNVPTAVEVIYTNTAVFPWRDDVAAAEVAGIGVTVPRRVSQVRMPGVQRYSQAKREATERLNKLRTSDLEVVLDVFDKGIAHEVGDVIEVTHPVGLSSKKLRIAEPELIGANLWRLTCSEYDPAAYSSEVAAAPTYADTNLVNPTTVPPNLSAFSVTVLPSGTRRFSITAPTGAPAGSTIVVRYVSGSSSSWGAMSQFVPPLAYDPNTATYTFETALPVAGTWSFGAKLVNAFGTECATAQFITAQALGAHPRRYDATHNILPNADWTVSLGPAYDHPNGFPDARALPGWNFASNGGTQTIYRNYDGAIYNVGAGGVFMSEGPRGTSTHYSYLYPGASNGALATVAPGQVMEASAYWLGYNCEVTCALWYLNSGGTSIGTGWTLYGDINGTAGTAGYNADPTDPANWPRLMCYGTAPTGAAYVGMYLLKRQTTSTGTGDVSYLGWHKAQLCKWGGGTNGAEALPWVPPTGVEAAGVNTGNLGAAAATEIYTAQSSGTGDAHWQTDIAGTNTLRVWSNQSCSVSVPVEVGDKLLVHCRFDGDASNAAAYQMYARVGIDALLPGGTGTAWYRAPASRTTGNTVESEEGVGPNTTLCKPEITHSFTVSSAGTATIYGGGGATSGDSDGAVTETGQTFLRVERVKR